MSSLPPSDGAASKLPERFGPFVLEKRLGVGGTAEVFLARPSVGVRPAPQFVIKRPLPGSDAERDFELLSREADLHQAVQHPNVVQVFGAGMVQGRPYLAMEYVDGVDAFRLLRTAEAERRALPTEVSVFIARRVALALGSVHEARGGDGPLGLVHGDVSPSNVYLSESGDVKLGDFGTARVAEQIDADSLAGEVKGKWGYVAPEVLDGAAHDHRADLFSLAAVLGELLIGESIFPGSSQLAVLLSIRDVNVEPLRRRADTLPRGLVDLLLRTLERDPLLRPASAAEFAAALEPYETASDGSLRATLGQWVVWARDPARLAANLEGSVRQSIARMHATRAVVIGDRDDMPSTRAPPRNGELSEVRRADGTVLENVPFAKLIELIATGDLDGHDEVALLGAPFRRIEDVQELARHLLPSTSTTTGVLFGAGVPDYAARLEATPMLEILATLRERGETGALFVEQGSGSTEHPQVRKEIYLRDGRLHHVASSAREELLGEYLVRRGKLTRQQLEDALAKLGDHGGRLGDTLVSLRYVQVMDLFRALRDQGRDRVGQLCAWRSGKVAFYRGSEPRAVQFPLDLDLASAMMSGAIVAGEGKPEALLPPSDTRLVPGPRAALAADRKERGTAPGSLQLVPSLLASSPTVADAVHQLTLAQSGAGGRSVGEREANAALVVAHALGWIAFG